MGYSTYFYVGAYLEITDTAPVMIPGGWKWAQCPRGHAVVNPGAYCSECGSQMVRKTASRNAQLHDLLPAELDGELSNCGEELPLIAKGNKRKPLPDHLDIGEIPFMVELDDPTMATTYIDNFYENYSDVIEELRKVATVEVKFGCIGYYW